MTSNQAICLDCHRFLPFDWPNEVCFKCQVKRILKTKIDTSGYDFTQPVVYRRKCK